MLAAAVERAEALLSSRVDVQQFRICATTGVGRRLVGAVSGIRGTSQSRPTPPALISHRAIYPRSTDIF